MSEPCDFEPPYTEGPDYCETHDSYRRGSEQTCLGAQIASLQAQNRELREALDKHHQEGREYQGADFCAVCELPRRAALRAKGGGE